MGNIIQTHPKKPKKRKPKENQKKPLPWYTESETSKRQKRKSVAQVIDLTTFDTSEDSSTDETIIVDDDDNLSLASLSLNLPSKREIVDDDYDNRYDDIVDVVVHDAGDYDDNDDT